MSTRTTNKKKGVAKGAASKVHESKTVGVSKGNRVVFTTKKTQKLNKSGDYKVTQERVYRKITPEVEKTLAKKGVKVVSDKKLVRKRR